MTSRICTTVARTFAATLVVASASAAPASAQARPSAQLASESDYLFVCRIDGGIQRCIEVLTSKDLRTGEASARVNYTELDTVGPDSRGLSCQVAAPALNLINNGKRLKQASIRVTVSPESDACLGSWGFWPAGPVSFAITLTASGGYSQQSKGHGVVAIDTSEYRFAEALDSWAVDAAGTVDIHDFTGAVGSVQTVRRTDVSKTK